MTLTLVSGWQDVPAALKGASVALGNFDGVHYGHRRVIGAAGEVATAIGAPLGVIRFSPHPARMMRPDAPPFLLMSPGQQARALDRLGVDILYDLPFAELLSLEPEAFCQKVLAEGLGVRHLVAGFDIRFGKGRAGDADMLRSCGPAHGFGVTIIPAVSDADGKLSSSAAREALRQGDVARAAAILGHPFTIEGVVVEGQHLGRKLGYPTANVELEHYLRPRLGSYATRTRLPDGRVLPGVANIGENPTTGAVTARLEVWLFDFDEDIYGQTIETELVAFIRPEAKFDGLEALIAQIGDDAERARALLG